MMLEGKRLIVTGAGSGLGRACATAFAREGAKVVAMGRDASIETIINDVEDDVRQRIIAIRCDVSVKASVDQAFGAAIDRLGGLDGLIHAAGIAPGAPAETIDLDEFEAVFANNMRGTFLTNQAVFPHLKTEGGRIINFASPVGVTGMVGKAHYAASKGAVLAWTRSVAREWGCHGITVNAVAPAIRSPMYERTRAAMSPEALREHDAMLQQKVPIGGALGDATRDFLPLMLFLVGDGARFLTGQTYVIDGGCLMMS